MTEIDNEAWKAIDVFAKGEHLIMPKPDPRFVFELNTENTIRMTITCVCGEEFIVRISNNEFVTCKACGRVWRTILQVENVRIPSSLKK